MKDVRSWHEPDLAVQSAKVRFRAKAEIADSGNQPLLITPSNRTDPKLDSGPSINMGSEIFAHLANRAHSSLHAAGVASARSGWRPPRSRS